MDSYRFIGPHSDRIEIPITRHDCARIIEKTIDRLFSSYNKQPLWVYKPTLHSPRLSRKDIEIVRKSLLDCLKLCEQTVEEDKDIPQVVSKQREALNYDYEGCGWD